MCGIGGHLNAHDPYSAEAMAAQLATLAHRGPDSFGAFGKGAGGVGQSRLAVIDLVTGDPPITDESGEIGVAQNGEIYNFAELRQELRAAGHEFRTSGDTEVIAHLAEDEEPVALARRLKGMFAAAIWDARRQRLVLVRDRLGKKPLHWTVAGGTFVFGSEIKTVLAHPAVSATMNKAAIPSYLRLGYVPTPQTFFEGIRSVRPGHVLVVDRDLRVTETPYWEPEPAAAADQRLDVGLEEAGRLVRDAVHAAVGRRLVADVPLGAFLSGGIDSTVIVAAMAEQLDRPVKTFTIGFQDDDGFDERPYARMAAERFGTDHTEFVVAPHAVDLVERLVWHHDQPFGDSSAIPTFLLSELTGEHVTVALSGDGGDELFAGYERFAAGNALGRLGPTLRPLQPALRWLATHSGNHSPKSKAAKAQRLARVAGEGLPGAFRELVSYASDDLVAELVVDDDPWSNDDYRSVWDRSRGAPTLDRLLLLNLRTYLLDDLLPKTDRMSMAHGLEVRSPFLDADLVELALRLPPRTKLRGTSLKRVLRTAFADDIPPAILDRPKRGFGVPLDRWFRDDLSAYVNDRLTAPDARIRGHLRPEVVERIVQQHRSGAANHGHVLWSLLTLEVFLRRYDW